MGCIALVPNVACSAPTTTPPPASTASVPSATPLATTGAPPVPSPVDAARTIYESFAQAPTTFDRLPHVSRFYVEQGRRNDEACRTGRSCVPDRFVCLEPGPTSVGRVERAQADGELPGVSASVRLRVAFGDRVAIQTVDLVFESGVWKVDQVRCPLPDDR